MMILVPIQMMNNISSVPGLLMTSQKMPIHCRQTTFYISGFKSDPNNQYSVFRLITLTSYSNAMKNIEYVHYENQIKM